MWRVDSLEKTDAGRDLGAEGEGDDRGWDGWMALLTRWMWVWVISGSWWWTGRPVVLGFMGSQRVGHDWATELNWSLVLWWESIDLLDLNWHRSYWNYNGHSYLVSYFSFALYHAQLLSCMGLFCNPLDCSLPGSSVHGILQVKILEWVASFFSRGPSRPKDQTCVYCAWCIGRWVLYHCATWVAPEKNWIVAQMVKNQPAKQETWVRSFGQTDPLEKEMATHSSNLA